LWPLSFLVCGIHFAPLNRFSQNFTN
jgi:hypothetical protein